MVKVIAEIGINHSGSMEECKKMMMLSRFKKEILMCVCQNIKNLLCEKHLGVK